MAKYKNVKTIMDGIKFDSKKECNRYIYLKSLEAEGKITNLELQPKFELQPTFKKDGKTYRAITYIADFKYFDITNGEYVVEDVKGFKTKDFLLKQKMFNYKYNEKLVLV